MVRRHPEAPPADGCDAGKRCLHVAHEQAATGLA